MAFTLLLGGARSGKSALAVRMAQGWSAPVTYIATAEASDDDMARRIARHRAERPQWPVVEEPVELARVLDANPSAGLVIDCLNLWVANLLRRGIEEEALVSEAGAVAELVAARLAPAVVVSNEVGLGVHPATEQGRRFRDTLGRVNAVWAAAAERSFLVVAGHTVELHPAPLPGQQAR
jgi:adenosylcobinamide kinase / adenosylcobinamide-phosphate guanylyltransferase